MLQTQNIRRVHRGSHAQHSTPPRSKPIDDNDPNSKSKDGPIKVILSLFGLLVVVFIMFSVFQPKKSRPPDRPPLKVFYDKEKFRNQHSHSHEHDNIKSENYARIIEDPSNDNDNMLNPDAFVHEMDLLKADSVAKDESSNSNYDESADIEFIDSGNADENSVEQNEDLADEIEDLYATASNPLRPPKAQHIEGLSSDKIRQFWSESVDKNDILDASNMPSADSRGHIYVMNYIFLPYEQMMTIFLLTSEYLNPSHGLHSWPSKRRRDQLPDLYKSIRETVYKEYKEASPSFACVFKMESESEEKESNAAHLWVSKVDFVPNNTTRDRYVNYGTEIMRCDVPMNDINAYYDVGDSPFYDQDYKFEFLLTQRWPYLLATDDDNDDDDDDKTQNNDNDSVHVSLSFIMGMRSGIKLYSNDDAFLLRKANQKRYLTLCMPPISEPLAFISEHIAHYVHNIGIEHIYIGTFFEWDKVEKHRAQLIERIQPWFDDGLITIWPHEQPWFGFTDKAKHHWLNQCLYYVKSRDSYTLSLDADEFLVLNEIESVSRKYGEQTLNERAKAMQSVLAKVVKDKMENEFDEDHFCWITLQSWQMWQLVNHNASFMVRRFVGREEKAQLTWSKVIWNNKHLWYTGYHAGGACSAQNHDWRQIVYDWREQRDPKYVYRFNPDTEAALFHYYNCRRIRIEPKDKNLRNPWSKMVNDTRMIDVYWENINAAFETHQLQSTYPDDSDVMNTKYYRTHYGFGNNMLEWHQLYND